MEKRDTKQEFITAFWKLYDAKPIEKISINQLCQGAGYNRSTFYNHFADIYDLLEQAVERLMEPVKAKVLSLKDIRLFLAGDMARTILFPYFLKKDRYIELLFKRRMEHLIGEKIKNNLITHIRERLKDENADFYMVEVILEYQLAAALGVIGYWYRQEKRVSEQEILKAIFMISSKGAFGALKETLDELLD